MKPLARPHRGREQHAQGTWRAAPLVDQTVVDARRDVVAPGMDHDSRQGAAGERANVGQRPRAHGDHAVDGLEVTPLHPRFQRGQRLARLPAPEVVRQRQQQSAARPASRGPVGQEDGWMHELVLNDGVVDRRLRRGRPSQRVTENDIARDSVKIAVPAQAEDIDLVADRSEGAHQRAAVDEAAGDLIEAPVGHERDAHPAPW